MILNELRSVRPTPTIKLAIAPSFVAFFQKTPPTIIIRAPALIRLYARESNGIRFVNCREISKARMPITSVETVVMVDSFFWSASIRIPVW